LTGAQAERLRQYIEGQLTKIGSPAPVLVLEGGITIDVLHRPEQSAWVQRRPFLSRFWRSYKDCRRDLGMAQSLRTAWVTAFG
jgi:hypothetical protein